MPKRIHSYIVPWMVVLLAAGCSSDSWDAPYREYLQRLSRTLDQPFATPYVQAPARMPRPSQLQRDYPADRLDGLDFLALHGCELQLTVGKKNSSLGRMARDSQRLLLELEYLQLAPGCIEQLVADQEHTLASTLQQVWNDKRRQLPGRIFDATLGGEEYRELWRVRRPLGAYPENTSAEPLQALGQVNALARRWLAGDYRFDNRQFEILLSEVAKGDGGQLWYALAVQAGWLETANAALENRRREGPLCAENYRPAAADILPNVVARFFVEGTQARAADMGQRYHQLLPLLQELEELLAEYLPEPYLNWKSGRDTQLGQLAGAPRDHVLQLQQLLAPCGGPGAQ